MSKHEWTIEFSVPDYEHSGDIEQEESSLRRAIKKGGLNPSDYSWGSYVENDEDYDEYEGDGYVTVSGEGLANKDSVNLAIDKYLYE